VSIVLLRTNWVDSLIVHLCHYASNVIVNQVLALNVEVYSTAFIGSLTRRVELSFSPCSFRVRTLIISSARNSIICGCSDLWPLNSSLFLRLIVPIEINLKDLVIKDVAKVNLTHG